jgi:DNA-binding response OmpR family regulator
MMIATHMATGSRPSVLLVEDESAIRDLVAFHLTLADYEFNTVADGTEALRITQQRPFDLIILDLLLPGIDGITVCQAIRREGPNREVPILMLTARAEEADRVLGLESGADDYLAKPFGVRELLARLKALLRRPRSTWRSPASAGERQVVSHLGVTVDPVRRRATVDGRVVNLTPHEFDLLYLLASNPGAVFGRDDILARVWKGDVFVTARGVDALVKRLRGKIEADASRPTRVLTAWGTGYKFGEG